MILEKIENLAPHWFIAAAVIFIAAIVIYNYSPPFDQCEPQVSSFVKAQQKFLISEHYDRFFDRCLRSGSEGGCEAYYSGISKMLDDMHLVEPSCKNSVARKAKIINAFKSFYIYIPKIAWGKFGPLDPDGRNSWLDSRHLKIFCRTKSHIERYYGARALELWEKAALDSFETNQKLSEVQKKERSLYATPCSYYL